MGPIVKFQIVFKQQKGIEISLNEIGYETISLYKDEIDEMLIPIDVLETLDELVVASTVVYTDEHGDEYMRIAVQDTETLAYDKYVRWFINYTPLDWDE
ncbi:MULTISPECIES: hypothetical protein [Lysinibacillus]|uniref:Uncharacterized protein n=1 Tax=Lysinibacillus fusiformis TaxID=28031 RepID=A0A1E4QZW2_9BACI|nr:MULTISPECIES: hypothetical protein [Lysinibacillus]ODV53737.1 hypothetical protein BG258_20365 [Lysinibacillus fusiformis]